MVVLGLRCCTQAFSSVASGVVAVCGPLIAVSSLVSEHGL